jgi:hypothetical protein
MSSSASTNHRPKRRAALHLTTNRHPHVTVTTWRCSPRQRLLQRTVALVTAAELEERGVWDAAVGDFSPAGVLQVTATCTALLLVTARGAGRPATAYMPSLSGRRPDAAATLVDRQLHATPDGQIADELVDVFITDHNLAGATMAFCAHATWAAIQALAAAHNIPDRDYLTELALQLITREFASGSCKAACSANRAIVVPPSSRLSTVQAPDEERL